MVNLGRLGRAFPRLALEKWTAALSPPPPAKRRVLVTAFRNHTWVEWAIYATCQLRKRGIAVTLVFSGSEVSRLYPLTRMLAVDQFGFWAGVQRIPDIRLVDLDDWKPAPDATVPYREFAADFAPAVAAYDLHVEENEEGPLAGRYRRALAGAERMLAETAAAFERILEANPMARVITYSGLIGRSPAICEVARRLGIEVLTVEGWAWRPGHMICNLNAPALEYNLDGWMKALGSWDPVRETDASRFLVHQETAVDSATLATGQLHSVQRSAADSPLPPDLASFLERSGPFFLLGTNVVGDSSMLRRRPIFRSQRDWLKQTIEFFRSRPQLNLVIRAHPDEAYIRSKVVVRMGEVARQMVHGAAPNVYIIHGDEDVSSYALIPRMAGGLVWISSIGVDMVARGVPVLAAARPKYHPLDLVDEPATIEQYFAAVERIAYAAGGPTKERQARALQYLSLVFSEFSFEAFSPTYRARSLALDGPADADLFYRILAGELPPETPKGQARANVA